ncbi:hypothetical protein CF394_13995 [Tetzosporium hominis]|uniref:Oligosaccharide repeat unit polymerase n=1 Tax=Tetzosporium hominis TaxID=2020506 RepID=A0A264W048_9BACL|nr:hypothetical protein [Tetzosporium hominis]OZS76958.1 hypothetical protein CF394_13995 [Tetzosporium hominis]
MNLYNADTKLHLKTNKFKFDYLPLSIIIFYLVGTYVLHLLLNDSQSILLLFFMTITNIFIVVGYLFAQNKISVSKTKVFVWEFSKKIEKLILVSMLITIISSINSINAFYYDTESIIKFILNPGKAYEHVKFLRNNTEYNTSSRSFGSTVSILLTLLSGLKYIYLVLSVIYWKELKNLYKILFFITSLIYLIHALLIGAMITIAGLLMSCIPIIINIVRMRNYNHSAKKNSVKRKITTLILLFTSVLLILFFIGNRIDENSSIFEGFKTILFYISHGYIGLEKAIILPFEFTFGFTTFWGITSYLTDFIGIANPFNNSYLVRNQFWNGWPTLSLWSTIYPWLASDFSFFMIPLIMGFVSYKFALIWNKTLLTNNPYGYLLLGQFFIFWLMIPANNQLFQTLSNASSFLLILFLYKMSKKFEKKKRDIF